MLLVNVPMSPSASTPPEAAVVGVSVRVSIDVKVKSTLLPRAFVAVTRSAAASGWNPLPRAKTGKVERDCVTVLPVSRNPGACWAVQPAAVALPAPQKLSGCRGTGP